MRLNSEDLSYGVLNYNRRTMIGVIGMGNYTGCTFISDYLKYEIRKRGLEKRVAIIDSPSDPSSVDCVILVIDPLPKKILDNIPIYEEVRRLPEEKVFYLVNKMNEGVNVRELSRFLKQSFLYFQEFISPEEIYSLEYSNKETFRYVDMSGARNLLDELLK